MARLRKKHDNIGKYNILPVRILVDGSEVTNEDLLHLQINNTTNSDINVSYYGSSKVMLLGFITFDLKLFNSDGSFSDNDCIVFLKNNTADMDKLTIDVFWSKIDEYGGFSTEIFCTCDSSGGYGIIKYDIPLFETSGASILKKVLEESGASALGISNFKLYLLNTGVPFQITI